MNMAARDTPPPPPSDALVCFTDGACTANGKKGARAAFAVVWPEHPDLDSAEVLTAGTATNNRAEYSALLRAFEQADGLDPGFSRTLVVYTDSMLLLNTVSKWMSGWKRKGWKKADGGVVANLDLVKAIDECATRRRVDMRHVKAHTGKKDWASVYNDRVDQLATGALKQTRVTMDRFVVHTFT